MTENAEMEWVSPENYAAEIAEVCEGDLDTVLDVFLAVLEACQAHSLHTELVTVIQRHQPCH